MVPMSTTRPATPLISAFRSRARFDLGVGFGRGPSPQRNIDRTLQRLSISGDGARQCTRCARGRGPKSEDELHFGRRHPVVLRHRKPGMAHTVSETPDCDKRIVRLIQKWLKAGVLEHRVVSVSEKGTAPGQ